jgi:hypothetical protein
LRPGVIASETTTHGSSFRIENLLEPDRKII